MDIPIATADAFADFVRRTRIERGLTQEELAKRAGRSRKWVTGVERQEIMPTLPAVISVAKALGYALVLEPFLEEDSDIIATILGDQ
ncbi:MAG: helix-turn-helix domain-containing protein [Scrofimicrobium sp.]